MGCHAPRWRRALSRRPYSRKAHPHVHDRRGKRYVRSRSALCSSATRRVACPLQLVDAVRVDDLGVPCASVVGPASPRCGHGSVRSGDVVTHVARRGVDRPVQRARVSAPQEYAARETQKPLCSHCGPAAVGGRCATAIGIQAGSSCVAARSFGGRVSSRR